MFTANMTPTVNISRGPETLQGLRGFAEKQKFHRCEKMVASYAKKLKLYSQIHEIYKYSNIIYYLMTKNHKCINKSKLFQDQNQQHKRPLKLIYIISFKANFSVRSENGYMKSLTIR